VTAPITPPYDRVPQWSARYAQSNVYGLDWSVDGDFTQFESDRSLTLQPNAQRVFAWAQASYPIIRPAGFLTPKLQLHSTTRLDTRLDLSGWRDRRVVLDGARLGARVSRRARLVCKDGSH
jgi:LPS-assembly protein